MALHTDLNASIDCSPPTTSKMLKQVSRKRGDTIAMDEDDLYAGYHCFQAADGS